MFEDSESESEADEAPAKVEPKPVAEKRRRPTPPPDDGSDSDEDRKRQVGPGFRRDEWRADALARSGAGDFGKAGSFVDRMAASFQAPRLVGEDEDAAPRRAVKPAPSHWTRESANAAKVRAELLRANPSSGRDGRAAYERPSMHGREMVISVGPSSLPSTCRVTRSRIPSANVKWS
jgi:hypothetical protein